MVEVLGLVGGGSSPQGCFLVVWVGSGNGRCSHDMSPPFLIAGRLS